MYVQALMMEASPIIHHVHVCTLNAMHFQNDDELRTWNCRRKYADDFCWRSQHL